MTTLQIYALGWGLTTAWVLFKMAQDGEVFRDSVPKMRDVLMGTSLEKFGDAGIVALVFSVLLVMASGIGSVWPVYWGVKFGVKSQSFPGSPKPPSSDEK